MKTSLAFKFARFAKKAGIRFDAVHDPSVIHMRSEIEQLDEGIQFSINIYPDGSWSAKSINVDGIITGGIHQSEIRDSIKDAIFTYYDVSPQYCDDTLLRGTGEKKTVKNEMYVTA